MIPILKAEFRKLLTVRSTYVILAIALLLVMLFAGFVEGVKGQTVNLLHNSGLLASESTNAIVFTGMVVAFAGLLLVGHEYRYNTIMYTLASSNRRYKILLAKFVAVSVFSIAASLFLIFFSPLCTILGAHLAGKQIGPQAFNVWSVVWHCILCGWGYSLYAFILVSIMRSQIGAIVTFLLIPMIGENILGLLLKGNVKYLPFNALQSIAVPTSLGNHTTSMHAVGVVAVYVAVGMLVSAVLFARRDAN